MKHRIWSVIIATGLLVACLTTRAQAQVYDPQTGDPPSGQHVQFTFNEWQVKPTADGSNVSGTCRIDCYTDEYDQVYLKLKGLQKSAKYTVWMVNQEKGEAGERAGVSRHWNGPEASQFFFTSEGNGNGFYNGWLEKCPLGKWKYLEVRYHPNGNVKDIDASVVIVRVRLKPQ